MANVLDTIISHKRLELAAQQELRPLDTFQSDVQPTSRNFLQALLKPGARFILNAKKPRRQRV
jgi:indole-3-glycerol phosphate synthase/phosphoribosylanthranilate isomerase